MSVWSETGLLISPGAALEIIVETDVREVLSKPCTVEKLAPTVHPQRRLLLPGMPRLLLIEDDLSLRRALRLALEKSGHEVVEANDGRAGLEAFKAQTIDLVITDLIMPEVEGVETIRTLRKLSKTVPIIAITGGGRGTSLEYLGMARTFGANEVMAKPFEFEALSAAVGRLTGKGS